VVIARIESPVPYTTLVLVTFDVEYALPQESGEMSVVQEKGIKSDRIRLFADAQGEVQGTEGVEAADAAALKTAVQESTGSSSFVTHLDE
jgi:hypothetical protein